MKKLKTILSNYYVILVVMSAVLIASCGKDNPKPMNTNSNLLSDLGSLQYKSGKGYSGEDIFRGVFFMNGAFFPEIPSYKGVDLYAGLSDTVIDSAIVLQNAIINTLIKTHPTFLNDFETEMKSGSCTRIDKALDKACTAFITTVNTMPQFGDLVKMDKGQKVIHKDGSTGSMAYADVPSDTLLVHNPELLIQNSLVNNQNPPQTSIVVALVAVVYVAAAVHNTVAVTGFVAGVGVAAVYLAVVLWTGKWCWSGALTGVPSGDIPANIRNINGLKYESFVSGLSTIPYK